MFELMKIVGVSAVLSAGLVTASEIQVQAPEPASGKAYTERLPQGDVLPAKPWRISYAAARQDDGGASPSSTGTKGDLLRKAPQGGCAAQAWPNLAPECLERASGASVRSVRMITIEQREGANTSVLTRVPAHELAQR